MWHKNRQKSTHRKDATRFTAANKDNCSVLCQLIYRQAQFRLLGLCNFVKHTTQGAPHCRNTEPGQEVAFGCDLLNQTLQGQRSSSCSPPSQPYLPGNPPPTLEQSAGATTKARQLISHPPSTADWPHLTHALTTLHRWLLHNKQHLLLISPKPKQHQEERSWGRSRLEERLLEEDFHRKDGSVRWRSHISRCGCSWRSWMGVRMAC